MKTLHDLVNDNRLDFDSDEPSLGHFERFQQKLNINIQNKRKKRLNYFLKIAAVAVILIVTGITFYKEYNLKLLSEKKNTLTLSEVSPEYKEVEEYLKTDVNTKIKQLESIKCDKKVIDKSEIFKELNEIEKQYKGLEQELYQNADDERIINAMINSYRIKSEVLDRVIKMIHDNC